MTDVPNLWPENLADAKPMLTPHAIFKHQAAALGDRTAGQLEGRVKRWTDDEGDFMYSFKIYSSTLDYAYELFTAWHEPVLLYPVSCRFGNETLVRCETEQQLIDWLGRVLSSAETKRVVASLLSQINEE